MVTLGADQSFKDMKTPPEDKKDGRKRSVEIVLQDEVTLAKLRFRTQRSRSISSLRASVLDTPNSMSSDSSDSDDSGDFAADNTRQSAVR